MSQSSASASSPRLLDQVREIIRIKHYSIRTEQAYTQWLRRYILYHGKRHSRDMGTTEVSAFSEFARDHGKCIRFHSEPSPQCHPVPVSRCTQDNAALTGKCPARKATEASAGRAHARGSQANSRGMF